MSRKFSVLMFLIILIIEIIIGMYSHGWIRYYFGDVLVMTAMYFLIRIFTDKFQKSLPVILFAFACFVEFLQYLDICGILGIDKKSILAVIIGTSGTWNDIPCYMAGTLLIYIIIFFQRRFNYGRISGNFKTD